MTTNRIDTEYTTIPRHIGPVVVLAEMKARFILITIGGVAHAFADNAESKEIETGN